MSAGVPRPATVPPRRRKVDVAVTPPYEVTVGRGVLATVGSVVREDWVALVSDSQVAPLYLEAVQATLAGAGHRVLPVVVPAGEESKSLAVLDSVVREFASAGLKRDSAVVALGGGVVSDLAGFAAASYLRGVAFYACPTTLLAMVDASVGGKTGVNLPEGKNLVGAFWQPQAVLADVATLATLAPSSFREGAVELYKHGLLADPRLLEAIRDPEFRPDGDPEGLTEYIVRSVAVKAEVVAADELEGGRRAHLNLGHTLAHALEAASDHQIPHGQAVGYGLLYAAYLGQARGWYDFTGAAEELLQWLGPAALPLESFDELLPFVLRDKKNSASAQRFVLLRKPTTPEVVADVDESEQRHAWGRLLEVCQ